MDLLESYLAAIFLSKKYQSAIEYGCCNGKLVKFISQFCKTTGIDIAKEYISQAKRNVPDADFRVADARRRLKLKADVGITHGFLIHVTPEDIKKTLRNMASVCKNLIIVESANDFDGGIYTQEYNPKKYWDTRAKFKDKNKDLPMKYYYAHDYESIFKELGLCYQLVHTFNPLDKTRMYLCWKK